MDFIVSHHFCSEKKYSKWNNNSLKLVFSFILPVFFILNTYNVVLSINFELVQRMMNANKRLVWTHFFEFTHWPRLDVPYSSIHQILPQFPHSMIILSQIERYISFNFLQSHLLQRKWFVFCNLLQTLIGFNSLKTMIAELPS